MPRASPGALAVQRPATSCRKHRVSRPWRRAGMSIRRHRQHAGRVGAEFFEDRLGEAEPRRRARRRAVVEARRRVGLAELDQGVRQMGRPGRRAMLVVHGTDNPAFPLERRAVINLLGPIRIARQDVVRRHLDQPPTVEASANAIAAGPTAFTR
jgi:hypothetical protein